jgi:hypothetical protein
MGTSMGTKDTPRRSTRGSRSRWASPGHITLLLFVTLTAAWAQQGAEEQGVNSGNYNIRQSVEFGYRFTDFTGNQAIFDTFVNLQQGPRLLDMTLEMRSLDHRGSLFDRLYMSNFGYGGDPNNVSRLRIGKNKWYDFDAMFRRDQNVWDYSLQANPLNPASTFANAPAGFNPVIGSSPHLFNTRRRMGDYNLTLLPQSKIRFRLGYSRNVNDGPTFSSLHQGTEALLLQDWRNTVNAYRLGVDFRFLPKTNISYDQVWSYYKGDTGYTDQNRNFQLDNGTPVDIGVSLNNAANQPCAGTFLVTGGINPLCNGYLSYSRNGRVRTNMPTEQLSIQSNYFKTVDLSGRVSYTGGDMNVDGYHELFAGRESRTSLRNNNVFGPAFGRHVAATVDFGATWHVTDRFRVLDTFTFSSFRNPGRFDSSNCEFFSPDLATGPNVFTPASTPFLTCPVPGDGVLGTPAHGSSSGPDVSQSISGLLLKQDEKTNLFQLEYDFTRKFGARLGYRFRHRAIADADFEQKTELFYPSNANRGDCALVAGLLPDGCTDNGDGSFTFRTPTPIETDTGQILINEHSGLFGIWARPLNGWRVNFDMELASADNSFTRISPRQWQEYRLRTTYRLARWASVSGSINALEKRNNVSEINNLQHNRMYGWSAIFDPNERISFELGYDYSDDYSQILVCFVSSTAPAGIAKCPGSTVLSEDLSIYANKSHYGYFDVMWKPVRRLTTHLGYNITSTTGSALFLNPNAPSGPLNSNYHRPYGGFDYAFAKRWTGKAYWGYYGYHEDPSAVAQDLFAPRNFRGNLVTLSMRYAF